jgi:hypothetical protein
MARTPGFYATARFAGVNDIPRDLGCLILNEKASQKPFNGV